MKSLVDGAKAEVAEQIEADIRSCRGMSRDQLNREISWLCFRLGGFRRNDRGSATAVQHVQTKGD